MLIACYWCMSPCDHEWCSLLTINFWKMPGSAENHTRSCLDCLGSFNCASKDGHESYPLVMTNIAIEHAPFIVDSPIKNGVFHSYVSLPEGAANEIQGLCQQNWSLAIWLCHRGDVCPWTSPGLIREIHYQPPYNDISITKMEHLYLRNLILAFETSTSSVRKM